MFSLESIGITQEESDCDKTEIEKFKNSIKLINGSYHIDLPWKTDAIGKVPNNFHSIENVAQNFLIIKQSKT